MWQSVRQTEHPVVTRSGHLEQFARSGHLLTFSQFVTFTLVIARPQAVAIHRVNGLPRFARNDSGYCHD
jgi:hypothetical protein